MYNVPLGDAYDKPANKRSKYAVRYLKQFVSRHMKSDIVKLSDMVNSAIWSRSISKPPRHIKVKTIKRDDKVYVLMPDEKFEAFKNVDKEDKAPNKKETKQDEKSKSTSKKKEDTSKEKKDEK